MSFVQPNSVFYKYTATTNVVVKSLYKLGMRIRDEEKGSVKPLWSVNVNI